MLHIRMIFLWFAFSFVLSACGGSSDESVAGKAPSTPGSITGTGTTPGYIRGTVEISPDETDVRVNGVNYKVDAQTTVTIDDQSRSVSDLLPGQVVTVEGGLNDDDRFASGLAERISYFSNVIGEITSIDNIESTFIVLGQKVMVGSDTVFGEGLERFTDLQSQMKIRVSGLAASDGEVQVTRLDLVTTEKLQVLGRITEVDRENDLFIINDLRIRYDTVAPSDPAWSEGDEVVATGTTLNDRGELLADTITTLDLALQDTKTIVRLEGLITDFSSAESFNVEGLNIVANFDTATSDTTLVIDGDENDLSLDSRIKLEGRVNEQGRVFAEQITIIHTGPVFFTGSIGERLGQKTHTFTSSALDKSLWITLTDIDTGGRMEVFRIDGDKRVLECTRTALSSFNNGVCYLENDGENQWEVLLTSGSDEGLNYLLTAYLRRAVLSEPEDVTAGTSLSIYQNAGDRKLYRLSTKDAPANAFTAVMIDGAQNIAQVFIQKDSQPGSGKESLFDCRLGNRILDRRHNYSDQICWLKNDGVSNWYISVESVESQPFDLHIDFIVPKSLTAGETVTDTLTGPFDQLYAIDVGSDIVGVSAVMDELQGFNSDGEDIAERVVLRMLKDEPPYVSSGYECTDSGFFEPRGERQCVVENNNGTGIWYILAIGEPGLNYTMTAEVNNTSSEIVRFAAGDEIYVDAKPATVQRYRVPKGPEGTVFFLELLEATDIDFSVQIHDGDPDGDPKGRQVCYITFHYRRHWEHCQLLNTGEGDWYITVRNVLAGSHTLWTRTHQFIDLVAGEPLRDSVIENSYFHGKYYRVPAPDNAGSITVTLKDKSDLVAFDVAADLDSFLRRRFHCSEHARTFDTSCTNSEVQSENYWYIRVKADQGVAYTVQANFE